MTMTMTTKMRMKMKMRMRMKMKIKQLHKNVMSNMIKFSILNFYLIHM